MESASSEPPPLGAILAGGQSRRFGSCKALARVGGRTIVERVRDALTAALTRVVVVANEPALVRDLGLPCRPDAVAGAGPLGGIEAALRWAEEEGRPGVLCVACDMPFVSPALLREIRARGAASMAFAAAPERGGRLEPLCAFYSIRCLPEVEARLARGDRPMRGLLESLGAERITPSEIRRWGDPDVLLLNVNTPGEHQRAERIAREQEP